MTRRRRAIIGILFATLLLFVGAVLLLPPFLERVLLSTVDSTIKQRCPSCITQIGRVDLSLRKLRLGLYELSISTPQSKGVTLGEGHVQLSLRRILERRIDIDDIILRDLRIVDFGDGSVVAQLARTAPAEKSKKEKPSPLTVALHRAELSGFSFRHGVDSRTIFGEDGRLLVQGIAEDRYGIKAELGSLRLQDAFGDDLELGRVQTSLELDNDNVSLEELKWAAGESLIRVEGQVEDELLSGSFAYELSSKSPLPIPELDATLTGKGTIDGSLKQPRIAGELENKPGTALSYQVDGEAVDLSRFYTRYKARRSEEGVQFELDRLILEGSGAEAGLVEPIQIGPEKLKGKLELRIASFAYEETKVENATLTLNLAGSMERPEIVAAGNSDAVTYAGTRLEPLSFHARYSDDRIVLDAAHSSQSIGDIRLKASVSTKGTKPIEADVEVSDLMLPEFVAKLECGMVSATLTYQFLQDAPLEGSGLLTVTEAFAGCAPEQIELQVAKPLSIEKGVLPLEGVSLVTPGGALEASGSVSHEDLAVNLQGKLILSDFARFLPDTRNLDGALVVALQVQGTPEAPDFNGKLSLSDASAGLAEGKVNLSELNADLRLDNQQLILTSFSALLNEGTLQGKGTIDLAEPAQSNLNLQVDAAVLRLAEPGAPSQPLTLDAEARISAGVIQVDLQELNGRFSLKGSYPVTGEGLGDVDLSIADLDLAKLLPDAPCTGLSLSGHYRFDAKRITEGEGELVLAKGELGCPPETIALVAERPLSIVDGALNLEPLRLEHEQSKLVFSGSVSTDEINAHIGGSVKLSAFASFATAVDDLDGLLTIEAAAQGVWEKPLLSGSLELTEGHLSVVKAGVELEDVRASVALAEDRLRIENFHGELNSGILSGHGVIVPRDLSASRLVLALDRMELYPDADTFIMLSATLESVGLGPDSLIKGEVVINEAVYEQNLEVTQLVRKLVDSFDSQAPLLPAIEDKETPAPQLNVKLTSPGGIFLKTNWAEAELKGDLQVKGTVAEPAFGGTVDTMQGFFGIGPREFEIISGSLIFTPRETIPEINLHAETEVVTAALERVMVFADIVGPLNDPRVTFFSDTGLSQQEVITLLSAGQGSSAQALVDTIAKESGFGSFGLIGEKGLPGFLGTLTTLDRLEIEPALNVETGAVEPRLIAERRLSSKLGLTASRTFAGVDSGSSVSARYSVNRRLEGTGGITGAGGAAGSEDTRLSADLSYALIPERRGVEVSIEGENHFDEFELLEGLSIKETTRVDVEQLPSIRDRVLRFYKERGFFETEAAVDCIRHDGHCLTLDFVLDEGARSFIEEIVFVGDSLNGLVPKRELIFSSGPGVWATKDRSEEYAKRIRRALRERDYLRARIKTEYLPGSEEDKKIIQIEITLKEPLRFRFSGNTVFSDNDLLGLLEIDERPYPLGINTPYILRDAVLQRYHAQGYADVEVELKEVEVGTYNLSINEGSQVVIQAVSLEGAEAFSRETLMEQLGERNREAVFSPGYLTPVYPGRAAEAITQVYMREGYPEASVTPIVERLGSGQAIVRFQVDEGTPRRALSIKVNGMPENVELPGEPTPPYSRAVLENYQKSLITRLEDRGYHHGQVALKFSPGSHEAVYEVTPGPITTISRITIRGLRQVDEDVVRRYLRFSPGDPWDRDVIGQSRRDLRRLGLFREVSIGPADEYLDSPSEEILVSVTERGLRHLNVGVGIDSAYGFRVFNDGADLSVFGDGKELSLNSDVYFGGGDSSETISRALIAGRYSDPFFLGSEYRFAEDLGYQRITDTTQEFDIDRFTLSSLLSRTLDNGFSYSFGHTLLKEQLNDVEPDVILSSLDTGSVRLAFLSGNVAYDKRDDPLLPARGYIAAADYKLSSRAVGSEADFLGLGAKLAVIYPLTRFDSRFSLANSTRAAAAWGYRNTEEIPISQRYYLGGRSSVRGFRENSLGPRGSLGHVIGGDRLFANSLELRFLVRPRIEVHTFLDAGNVFLSGRGDYDLRWGSGVGARYLSPVGPIGFDIGVPLDEKPGEPSIRFHFSVGAVF